MKSFRGLAFLLALSLVFVAASALLLAPQSFAQSTQSTGGIAGTLTDSQGASVPGATVTISNKETGFTVNLTTGPSGVFSVGNIAPGNYQIGRAHV